MDTLKAGTTLHNGKYRIERVLGQGGFGITYEATMKATVSGALGNLQVNIKVAIKEFFMKERCLRDGSTSAVSIPSEASQELVQTYRHKFVKEAHNLSAMNHPNVVKVTEVFEENDTVYYVMQFAENGSLSDYVKGQPGKRLNEDEALRITRQLGSALDYMHSQKHICHLDVKPGNVLLDDKFNAVLIDFGLSKNYDEQGNQTSSTPVGISKGYAPLEQYQQTLNSFTPQTDLYALGATLHFLLTGQTPPEASIINEEGFPACPAGISQPMWAAIEAAMQPRRRDRPASVAAWLKMLPEEDETIAANTTMQVVADNDETIINSTQAAQTRSTVQQQQPAEPIYVEDDDSDSRRKWLYIGGAAIALAILGFLFFGKGEKGEPVLASADSTAVSTDTLVSDDIVAQDVPQQSQDEEQPKDQQKDKEQPAQVTSEKEEAAPMKEASLPTNQANEPAPQKQHEEQPAPAQQTRDNKVYDVVEQQPQFPGGQGALVSWIA